MCTSPLVFVPPQLTLFTSPTTLSTSRHVRSRQSPTLDIWQSPDRLTGKRKRQINGYVYIYMRLLFQSARLGLWRSPLRMTSSVPKKTRIPVGQPIQIRIRDRPPRRLLRRQLREPGPYRVEATSSYPPPPSVATRRTTPSTPTSSLRYDQRRGSDVS